MKIKSTRINEFKGLAQLFPCMSYQFINQSFQERNYKCNLCELEFAKKSSLKTHYSAIHQEKRYLKCNICDKTITQNTYLKRHIIAVHDKAKSFKCPMQ